MTLEGIVWEDIHHFVDYLTCKDVVLAYRLNEMLLYHPNRILHQFDILSRLMDRTLCNHELMGHGYVFTREPVISPSDLVGRLVVKEEVERLGKGMAYLTVLDADFIRHQRYFVHGMDLTRIQKSAFLLVEAFEMLHMSLEWTEAYFVEVLKEIAVFYPNAASTLHFIDSSFVLVELLLYKKEMMTRFVELRRLLWSPFNGIKLLNEMGRHPQLLLHETESVFQRFKSWLPIFISAGYNWKDALLMCRVLHSVWKSTSDSIDAFMERAQKLHDALPGPFMRSLEQCLQKDDEEMWMHAPFPDMLQNCDEIVQRWQRWHSSCQEAANSVPVLLTYSIEPDDLKDHLYRLRENFTRIDAQGTIRFADWINADPSVVQNPASCLEMWDRVWPIIAEALAPDEIASILSASKPVDLVEAAQKLDAVVHDLQDSYGLTQDAIHQLFKEKAKGVRQCERHIAFPVEIVSLLCTFPATKLAEILTMTDADLATMAEQLFVLFGASPSSIFSNLQSMPQLLLEKDTLNDAVSVARCFKVRRTDLRNRQFRTAGPCLSFLIQAFRRTRRRPDLHSDDILGFLEKLSDMELFEGDDVSGFDPLLLAQFLTLCVEHLGAWEQFAFLMSLIHHPLLAQVRPKEVQKMKREAFCTILVAPEIFLIRILWDQMVEYLTDHQWTFAGLDVETVLATESCVFFHAVQEKWRHTFDRNARKLFDAPRSTKRIRRRGKSIVAVEPHPQV